MATAPRAVRGLLLGALLLPLFAIHVSSAAAAPCDPPVANPITCENSKPGTPQSQWDVNGAGSASIQGFATRISVNQGQTVRFKVDTDATDYRLDIYRMGYYDGDGARRVATVQPSASLPQTQPACLREASTGLVDCGNWAQSASWAVPPDAVSGIYFAKLVREDGTPGASHVFFVVRDDDGHSDLLFQTSDTTWEAYNRYGGNSLYTGGPGTNPDRAYKVSYNRPLTTRGPTPEDSPFNAEYPMVRWLERNGYDVSYFTGVDAVTRGAEMLDHKAYLSVGHDEYWSGGQRTNVEKARDAGVNLAFFSGNESFWKTRWEPSIDSSATDHRTLVSYKETHANAKIDPTPTWTGTWRDPRPFNPEGGQPENALSGTIFTVNCCTYAIKVPAADGKLRLWRNTSIASLAPGHAATLPDGTLGYEWDEDLDNGARPPGLVDLSSTTVDVPERVLDYGSNYGPGTATHHLTLYRAPSGALVFGAGTVQWSWGLDGNHDRGGSTEDPRMQQATVNLFADMGVQPDALQGDLQPATASTDSQAPTSHVTSPADGSTIEAGGPVTIHGTAQDAGGGKVGGVEVSADGGATWHPAQGRQSWTYVWTPGAIGDATIKSRSVDDSGNLEAPGPGATVHVAPRTCPCSIWGDSFAPSDDGDSSAVEVGVKFRSDEDGFISGLRFYKTAANTGTHVGHLWTTDGTELAEATFAGETASGWQEVEFPSPVPIQANTTYIASYHAPNGHYASSQDYFAAGGFDSPPLHALGDGVDGPNGVFKYGPAGGLFAGGAPDTFRASNYWVDVVFEQEAARSNTQIDSGPSGLTNDPTPTFAFSSSEAGSTFSCKVDSSPYGSCASPKTTTHLADGPHTFYVRAKDADGNVDPTPASRSFTVQTAAVHKSGSTLQIQAASGAKDNLSIAMPSSSTLRVTDTPGSTYTGSGLHAWAGCARSGGDYTAVCDASGITSIQVVSGDQIDRVVNSTAIGASINGGPAGDQLIGGSGRDTVTGGPGPDVIRGMNGNDLLVADDGTSDRTINCDGGSTAGKTDRAVLDLLPKDPAAVVSNCETVMRH